MHYKKEQSLRNCLLGKSSLDLQIGHIIGSAHLELMCSATTKDNVLRFAFGAVVLCHLDHILAIIRVRDCRGIFDLKENSPSHCNLISLTIYQ